MQPAHATYNVHEAKTHLSRLLERVTSGEEIVLARAGRPVARLVPVAASGARRVPGTWRGRLRLAGEAADERAAPPPAEGPA